MDIQEEDEEEDGEGGLEAQVYSQCCGTVSIFYGSGSDYLEVTVPLRLRI
jgi:hypothetical protein